MSDTRCLLPSSTVRKASGMLWVTPSFFVTHLVQRLSFLLSRSCETESDADGAGLLGRSAPHDAGRKLYRAWRKAAEPQNELLLQRL